MSQSPGLGCTSATNWHCAAPFRPDSGIVGIIAALVTTFKPNWSPYSAPVYAIAKGLALGGISAFMELRYPGVVIQALMLTFGTLFGLLTAFRTRMITVNEGFRTFVSVATAGFFIGMLGMFILQLCGVGVSLMSGASSHWRHHRA